MDIVFVDDGESNRALIARSIYEHLKTKIGKKRLPDARVATLAKLKSLHTKGQKALKEFGIATGFCTRNEVERLGELKVSKHSKVILLGQDNDKKSVKKLVKDFECWPIDNPLQECENEIKLRFFRRVRDQLWVRVENLIGEFE